MDKPILYTAFKPTNRLQLGNFIAVGQDLKNYQKNYTPIIAIADLHALTINLPKEQLEGYSYSMFAMMIAMGVNPNKTILYMQSHVKEHSEIAWILNNFTMFGEASRMTQFKDHVAKGKEVNVGLFTYPVLMAGDILLYNTQVVPVGIDQAQHVELCRVICKRFNNRYGETFVMPTTMVKPEGSKIMGLLTPEKKMSKSDISDDNVIHLDDTESEIRRKFKRAVTDSDGVIKYDPKNKPGVSNLLNIYASLKGISIKKAEKHFAGQNYGTLKTQVADVVCDKLRPVREKYLELMADKEGLRKLMQKGAKKASKIAAQTLAKARERVGLV